MAVELSAADRSRRVREVIRRKLVAEGKASGPNEIDRVYEASVAVGRPYIPETIPAAEDTPWYRRIGDVATGIDRGAMSLAEGALNLVGAERAADWVADRRQASIENLSPEHQRSMHNVETAEGAWNQAGALAANPLVSVERAVQSVPSMMAMGPVGRAIGGAFGAVTGRAAPAVARAAGAEGVLSAVQTGGEMRDEGYDWGRTAAGMVGTGLATAGVGYAGSRLARALGTPDIEEVLTARTSLARRAVPALTAVPQEAVEEGFQEVGETAAGGLARGEDVEMRDLTRSFLDGAAAGAVMAGGFTGRQAARAGLRRRREARAERVAADRGSVLGLDRQEAEAAPEEPAATMEGPAVVERSTRLQELAPVIDDVLQRGQQHEEDAVMDETGQHVADFEYRAERSPAIASIIEDVAEDVDNNVAPENRKASPTLHRAFTAIRNRTDISEAERSTLYIRAAARELDVNEAAGKLGDDTEAIARLDRMSDLERQRAHELANEAAEAQLSEERELSQVLSDDIEADAVDAAHGGMVRPFTTQDMRDRNPEYQVDYLVGLNRTLKREAETEALAEAVPAEQQEFKVDTDLDPGLIDETGAPVGAIDHVAEYERALDADHQRDVAVMKSGQGMVDQAGIRLAKLDFVRGADADTRRAMNDAARRSPEELRAFVDERVLPNQRAILDADNKIRKAAGIGKAKRGTPSKVKNWITDHVQRGAVAHLEADAAVARGLTKERFTQRFDRQRTEQQDFDNLFGDLLTDMNRQGIKSKSMNDFVKDGEWQDLGPEVEQFQNQMRERLAGIIEKAKASGITAKDVTAKTWAEQRQALGVGNDVNLNGVLAAGLRLERAAERNLGARDIINYAVAHKGAQEVGQAIKGETVTVKINGQDHHFLTDPWLAAVAATPEAAQVSQVMRIISAAFRNSILTFNVGWQIANIPIDKHRAFMNDPRYEGVRGFIKMVGDMGRDWGAGAETGRNAAERSRRLVEAEQALEGAVLQGDTRRANRMRKRIENIQRANEAARAGFATEGQRARLVRDPFDVEGKGRTVALSEYFEGGKNTETGVRRYFEMFRRPFERAMVVVENQSKLQAYERWKADPRGESQTTAALRVQETIGAPPAQASYRGANPLAGKLMQFYQAIMAGNIADAKVHLDPKTRASAAMKFGMTVLAPTLFQLAVRNNAFGTEDDEGFWGDYTRALQGLPSWRAGLGWHVPLPFATRINEEGQQEQVVFTLPVNRFYAPVLSALADGFTNWRAGESGGKIAWDSGKAAVAGTMPSAAVGVDLARDVYDLMFTERGPLGGFEGETPVFTPTEMESLGALEKGAKFVFNHAFGTMGQRQLGNGVLLMLDRRDLSSAKRERAEQGGAAETIAAVPLIGSALKRVYYVGERTGRAEEARVAAEVSGRARRAENVPRTRRMMRAVNDYIEQHRTFNPDGIYAMARRWAASEGDVSQAAARIQQAAQQAVLGYREGRAFSELLRGATEDGVAAIRQRGEGAAPAIREWTLKMRRARAIGSERATAYLAATAPAR